MPADRPDHKSRQTTRIVQATMRLIQAHGLSRVNMSMVAEQAGLSRQTIYNYFPDLESIVAEALDQHGLSMVQHLLGAMEQPPTVQGKLRALASFLVAHASPEHTTGALESVLSSQAQARLAVHTDAVKAALAQILARGIAAQELRSDLAPQAASELLWGLVQGAVDAASRYPAQSDRLLEATHRAMWGAVAAEPSPGADKA